MDINAVECIIAPASTTAQLDVILSLLENIPKMIPPTISPNPDNAPDNPTKLFLFWPIALVNPMLDEYTPE